MLKLFKQTLVGLLFAAAFQWPLQAQQLDSAPVIIQETFVLVNEIRAKGCECGGVWYPAVQALIWNDKLAIAAEKHAADMQDRGYFGHVTPDGVKPSQRVEAEGYNWFKVGENIAWLQKSAQEVVGDWLKSPGHCRNIMNQEFTETGIGKV
ncbi:MAG TPA: CAP domain-containing protein, partial [Microscillaceae bacterium]|nr:CAP domain-containing protein [Microscillaceae bacterium]